MLFLTLVIGMLNVCLGYALAVYLGYGPPGLLETWEAILSPSAIFKQGTAYGEPGEEPASTSIEQMLDDELEDEAGGKLGVEVFGESDDEGRDESRDTDSPENWYLDEKYVETSILKLNIAIIKSGIRTTEIDTHLRECQGRSDPEAIRKSLAELKEDCETYLAELTETAEQFSKRIDELGELKTLGDEIEMTNLEQSAQIETTLSNLTYMDFDSDLEAANVRLLEEIDHLRIARHRLRDNREVAFLQVARYENRMEKIANQLNHDPLTKLRSRIGLETTLWRWWQQGRQQSRQMNATLFDLDGFGRVNLEYGSLVGDRILYQLGQFIREKAGTANLVGRFAGQRFLIVMIDVGPRAATKSAELIRKSTEKISFVHGGQEIRVTLAGSYTEVSPDDTLETLFHRLEEGLKQAKQSGPNWSFFHDGAQAELVESPALPAKDVEILI